MLEPKSSSPDRGASETERSSLFVTVDGITGGGESDPRHEPASRERLVVNNEPKKLGIALVGLGKYSTGQLAPALKETLLCCLKGIVTGSKEKAKQWKLDHDLSANNIYSYTDFDKIKDNKEIDIVYVALPNALHAEYVIKAANAGKHVICEKPMATSVEDCERMIRACEINKVMLSIGYRLHFEPHHQEVIRFAKEKVFGEIKSIKAEHGLADASGWRVDKTLAGGGPLMDVGIYCVQAARYVTGEEPLYVTAKEFPKKDTRKHATIEESIRWNMEFPSGIIAESYSSYTEKVSTLHVQATNGFFELSPAYGYAGIAGKTSNGRMDIPNVNQQARQMDDFAMCISANRPTLVSGEMGLQDVKILVKIYEALRTGQRVKIE